MPRDLTTNERAVLAHVVVDPDAWWAHACAAPNVSEEAALAGKVSRWQPEYDAAVLTQGQAYQTRAQREEEAQGAP